MKLSNLIKSFRQQNNLSQLEFSQNCGLSKGYISMLETEFQPNTTNKKIIPSISVLRKLAKGMGLSLDELLKRCDDDQQIGTSNGDNIQTIKDTTDDDFYMDEFFPLHYCTNLQAGSFDELMDAEPNSIVYVPIKFLRKKKNLLAFKVVGDSMNNVIPSGSIVVAEKVDNFIKLTEGTIVVAFQDGQATIKRLFTDDKSVFLTPDSTDKSYKPIIINTEYQTLEILGKVIWHSNPDDICKSY